MKQRIKILIISLILLTLPLSAFAKYNAVMAPKFKWFDGNGDPASGYCVYSYSAGTSTESTTYDAAATADASANDWPVVLDSNGEADVCIGGSHKIVLRTDTIANGGTIEWTLDNYEGVAVEAVVTSISATLAAITDGETDGEMKIIAATGNRYTWDNGNSKWRVQPGNFYATASLPASASYTIETGCTAFDTTVNMHKRWDGDSWDPVWPTEYETVWLDASSFMSRTTNGASFGTNQYASNTIMKDYWAFTSGATVEAIQLTTAAPPEWDLGTVDFKIYWSTPNGSNVGDLVNWLVSGVSRGDSDAIDTATGAAVTISDGVLAVHGADLQISGATGAMTFAGTPATEDLLTIEIIRHTQCGGNDNLNTDAWFFGTLMKYKRTKDVATW